MIIFNFFHPKFVPALPLQSSMAIATFRFFIYFGFIKYRKASQSKKFDSFNYLLINFTWINQGKVRVEKSPEDEAEDGDLLKEDFAPHNGHVNALVVDQRTR